MISRVATPWQLLSMDKGIRSSLDTSFGHSAVGVVGLSKRLPGHLGATPPRDRPACFDGRAKMPARANAWFKFFKRLLIYLVFGKRNDDVPPAQTHGAKPQLYPFIKTIQHFPRRINRQNIVIVPNLVGEI